MTQQTETRPARRREKTAWLGLRPETLVMLVLIAVLLVPLSALSQPRDSSSAGGQAAGRGPAFPGRPR
jgi:hypothetical protein